MASGRVFLGQAESVHHHILPQGVGLVGCLPHHSIPQAFKHDIVGLVKTGV
jgi:hypothetical protein